MISIIKTFFTVKKALPMPSIHICNSKLFFKVQNCLFWLLPKNSRLKMIFPKNLLICYCLTQINLSVSSKDVMTQTQISHFGN